MDTGKRMKFKEWDCEVHLGAYMGSHHPALELIEVGTGEPIAMATTHLPNVHIPKGYVAIKDYSENSGMLAAMREAGIVDKPHDWVSTGFVSIPICKLLIPLTDPTCTFREKGQCDRPEHEDNACIRCREEKHAEK